MERDKARRWTDRQLRKMERKISNIYKKSAKDIIKKWDDFMQESADKVAQYQTEYEEALANGNENLIKKSEHSLKTAVTNQTLGNRYFRSMVSDVTTQLSNLNEKAVSYVNGMIPNIYTKNFGFIDKDTEKVLASNAIDFSLVDESVIKRRILDGDITLPKKKVDVPKDKKWNTKQLNSSVLQGILQGESMDEIAKRILPIVDNNEVSSIRNARTMVTQAENQGRLDRYKELERKGVVIRKVWMATGDDRTRGWHLSMDGQEKELDDPFIDGNGKELMMPGDPKGPANSVYNCRCTTKSHILGFRKPDGSINYIDYDASQDEPSLHQQEMEREIERRNSTPEVGASRAVVDGKDISATWTRRSDQFDFTIDDVVNAQGFDGLPKVVSAEEFEKAVNKSNIIAMRGYRAPDNDTLVLYQNELYNGKWYVDCSKGGDAYGKGMYTAYNIGTKANENVIDVAKSYSSVNIFDKSKATGVIETMTVDPSAKIIKHEDAQKLCANYRKTEDSVVSDLIHKKVDELSLSDNERTYVLERYFDVHNYDVDIASWYFSLDENDRNSMDSKINSVIDDIREEVNTVKQSIRKMDEGTVAALYGYDAVSVGADNEGYLIILNRTKVIIKENRL